MPLHREVGTGTHPAIHHGGLETIHAELRAHIDDSSFGEPLQDSDEASEDVPFPDSVTHYGAAHMNVLMLVVDTHVEPMAFGQKTGFNAVDMLLYLESRDIRSLK